MEENPAYGTVPIMMGETDIAGMEVYSMYYNNLMYVYIAFT